MGEYVSRLAGANYQLFPTDTGHLERSLLRIANLPEEAAEEIIARMKKDKKKADKVADEALARMYADHIVQVEQWLAEQPNADVLYVPYDEVLRDPGAWSAKINGFVDGRLDERKMAEVVDSDLYRQRHG